MNFPQISKQEIPGLKPTPTQGKPALRGRREYENTKAAQISLFYLTL